MGKRLKDVCSEFDEQNDLIGPAVTTWCLNGRPHMESELCHGPGNSELGLDCSFQMRIIAHIYIYIHIYIYTSYDI